MYIIKNVFEELAYLHMQRLIKKRPLDINIETVSTCPLKCSFCCNNLLKKEYTVMDNELFEKIIKEFCGIGGGGLAIGSMQSDFLSDPMLMDRLRIIRKYKKNLWLYSTTTLITCKKYSDKELFFLLSLFDCLQISVEGYDRESYSVMAGIDGFDIFKEQLERVKKIIDDNFLTIKIGIYFRTNNRQKLLKSRFYKEVSHEFHIVEVRDSFFSWGSLIKKENLPKGAKLLVSHNQGKRVNCAAPNATMSVQANGRAIGCGCVDWREKYVIGDCRKNTLEEIWRGGRAVKFRNAFKRRTKLPSICRECGLYSPMDECMKDRRLLTYKPMDGLYYLFRKG